MHQAKHLLKELGQWFGFRSSLYKQTRDIFKQARVTEQVNRELRLENKALRLKVEYLEARRRK